MTPDIGAAMTESAAAPAPAPAPPLPTAAACIPNIGRRGRRLRYAGAAAALVLALVGAGRILVLRMPPLAMAGPALAFIAAALGYFQAREKT
jgi:hypothetical protein